MYRYADRLVGELMAMMDADTTLVVLSDHGFELGALPDDPSKTRDMRRVSERYHRDRRHPLPVRARRDVRGSTIDRPTLLDVAPTVLALIGVAPARDMPGRVLTDGLRVADPPRQVASYETGDSAATPAGDDAVVDPAVLEHLRSLGYLDTESPKGDRNLAAVLFQQGKYAEAADAYAALVRASPDDGALRASWAGALGALGRYDEALRSSTAPSPPRRSIPRAYHNRGVIYEHQGQRDAAIAEYRTALRYNPQYAPSREALRRLGAGTAVATASDADRQRRRRWRSTPPSWRAAATTPGRCARSTRPSASRRASALVYQYRANVAFLMGDRAARSPRCSRRSRSSRTTRCSGRTWRGCAGARRRSAAPLRTRRRGASPAGTASVGGRTVRAVR